MAVKRKKTARELLNLPPEDPIIQKTFNPSPQPIQKLSNPMGGTGTSPERELELFGTPEQQEEAIRKEREPTLGVLKNAETGRLTGVTRGDRTILGISPREVTRLATKESELQELPIGGQAEGVISAQQQKLQKTGLNLSAQIGQDPLQQIQTQFSANNVDYLGAIMSTTPGIIPDALAYAGTFAGTALVAGQLGPQAATPEEVITVPAAAIVGAIIGGVKGFFRDFVGDLSLIHILTLPTN